MPSFPLPASWENAKLVAVMQIGTWGRRSRIAEAEEHCPLTDMDMAGPRYDTVMERCFPSCEKVVLTYLTQYARCTLRAKQPGRDGPDPIHFAQVRDVIETVATGRKYEVLLLRSQGKSMSEIAMILSISKSAVRSHYRRAIQQIREALGFEYPRSRPPVKTPAAIPSV